MSLTFRAAALGLLVTFLVGVPSPATAACGQHAELGSVVEKCSYVSTTNIEAEKENYPIAVWKAVQICKDGKYAPNGDCYNPNICVTASGLSATEYTITRDGEYVGIACLTTEEAGEVPQPPMSVLVLTEFKKLKWPRSVVSIQPRGETLVNLETIFYTDNNQPSSVTVTLLSKKVTIEAKPVSYTWSFGDGTTLTTDLAGKPHPSRDITHVYTSTEPVTVSVATTYQGTYTVEGKAPRDISETLTVEGPEASLEVLEAKPQLVLR